MNKTSRRRFLGTSLAAGAALSAMPLNSCARETEPKKGGRVYPDYSHIDKALDRPVLRRELFPDPVIIESLELLMDRNSILYRVRCRDGAEGISSGHQYFAPFNYPIVPRNLARHFVGSDARDLDQLIFNAVDKNIKVQGVPLNVHVAGIEFAILDMMGILADKPAGQLVGELLNPEISIYLGHHFDNFRHKDPSVSLELMQKDVEQTRAKAVKIRAGSGDYLGVNNEIAAGRTEKLIRMAREKFGDRMVLMNDGNGTYDVKEAIRIGKLLEEYNYDFWEEPVPWDWYEEQKQVEEALQIKMAGGEEEFGMHAFRYLAGNEVFQILQPDLFYFGGMIRTMKVARMAEAAGLLVTPHITRGGFGFLYMLHMVAVSPAIYAFHEFKMFDTPDGNGNIIPIENKTGKFECRDGRIKAPQGSGLGIRVDPDYIKTHRVVKG